MEKKTIYIVFGVVALALLLMVSSQYLAGAGIGGGSVSALSDADNVKGAKDAQTVLIEYGDYQCPACSAYHPMVEQVLKEVGQTVAFSFRHFPLSQHLNAPIAAYAAEAAGIQGKYWEMHNKLYENQTLWAEQTNARDHFIAFAKDIGLDVQKFQNDLDSQQVKDKVQKDLSGGLKANINQTPTFFVNGKMIENPKNIEEFKAALAPAQ